MRAKRSIQNEDGWLLIEVIMGAVLVLIVTVGLLDGFDSSTKASSIDKQRSVASSLAQTDQERMRTYTVAYLSNLRATVPASQTTVGGVVFTVKERADWVNDNSGIATCTSSSSQGSYIEITSTVTWPGMGTVTPVTAQSLVTPPVGSFGPGQGSVGIQVTDGSEPTADPVAAIPVQLGTSLNDVTDDNGCAVFGYIPSGPYVAQVQRNGWVDWGGNTPAKRSCPVPSGSTAICPIVVDLATSANITFWTQSYGSTGPNDLTSASAQQATLVNPKMVPPAPETQLNGKRPMPASPGGWGHTINATNLFPFPGGYGAYAGAGCPSADPANWTNNPAAHVSSGSLPSTAPGGPPQELKVTIPSLLFHVINGSTGGQVQNGSVTVVNADSSCAQSAITSAVTNGQVDPTHTGYPIGHYLVCARDGDSGSLKNKVNVGQWDNDDNAGTPANLTISSTNGSSTPAGGYTCPPTFP